MHFLWYWYICLDNGVSTPACVLSNPRGGEFHCLAVISSSGYLALKNIASVKVDRDNNK